MQTRSAAPLFLRPAQQGLPLFGDPRLNHLALVALGAALIVVTAALVRQVRLRRALEALLRKILSSFHQTVESQHAQQRA